MIDDNAFKQYQEQSRLTYGDIEPIDDNYLIYIVLGLVSESGEVADKLKKLLRDKGGQLTEDDKREIVLELGDVLWYMTQIATNLGYSLDSVARMNIDKLASRQARNKISGSGDNR